MISSPTTQHHFFDTNSDSLALAPIRTPLLRNILENRTPLRSRKSQHERTLSFVLEIGVVLEVDEGVVLEVGGVVVVAVAVFAVS